MYKNHWKGILAYALTALIFLGSTIDSLAQSIKTIRGKVISKVTGVPIAGVSITDNSSNKSTSTTESANFEIDVAEYAALSFRYVGFINQVV